jgi:hypothetical protein
VNGLVNVIHEPTHFTANSSSSIDPILVSDTIRTIESGTIPIDRAISDHDCTYVEIDRNFKLSKCIKRVVWDYKHGDYVRFRHQVGKDRIYRNCAETILLSTILFIVTMTLTFDLMTPKSKGLFPFHRGIMWPSLLKIQYTELKLSCGNHRFQTLYL